MPALKPKPKPAAKPAAQQPKPPGMAAKPPVAAGGGYAAQQAALKPKPPVGGEPEAPPPGGAKSSLGKKVYARNQKRTSAMKIQMGAAHDAAADLFEAHWNKHRARYEAVAAKTDVPAKLIAALHWRESSGNFKTYLHQGDPLGKPAVHVPKNIPVFHKWEDAAIHALQMKNGVRNDLGIEQDTKDPASLATYAEFYNGLGYHNRGVPSPYVYSGTNQYSSGKYVADGKYNAKVKDKQVGVMALMDRADDQVIS